MTEPICWRCGDHKVCTADGPRLVPCPECGTDRDVMAAKAVQAYDRHVRENNSPEWNTLTAVATCDDGLYGAFGELVDTAEVELGYGPFEDDDMDALANAFRWYQVRLRNELAAA